MTDVLRDPDRVAQARVLPYQLIATLQALSPDAAAHLRAAPHDTTKMSVALVPVLPGLVAVGPDVSGSMSSSVTGFRKGATSAVCCIDVAALVAASMLHKNAGALVLQFEVSVRDRELSRGVRS